MGFGIIFVLIQLIINVIIRGVIGGFLLKGVTGFLKAGKNSYENCFAISIFSHAIEVVAMVVLGILFLILRLLNLPISSTFGIEMITGSTNYTMNAIILRVIILIGIYTYFSLKFLNTTLKLSIMSSLFTVVLYMLLGIVLGFIISHNGPFYEFGHFPRWM